MAQEHAMGVTRPDESIAFVNTGRLPSTNRGKPALDHFRVADHSPATIRQEPDRTDETQGENASDQPVVKSGMADIGVGQSRAMPMASSAILRTSQRDRSH